MQRGAEDILFKYLESTKMLANLLTRNLKKKFKMMLNFSRKDIYIMQKLSPIKLFENIVK